MNGEVINFLDSFTKSGAPVKDLSRFEGLMHRLGNPQDTLDFIHVAGTNGKGSVVRMIASCLALSGYKTGEFTSPFIYRYNDRIKINGKDIPDDELTRIVRIIKHAIAGSTTEYSQFEITNAIAFIYFAEQDCDAVVLETGLGGLYDSTNIIKDNICSVITSISLDHTNILGDTIEKIAFQKAGIIKEECPVIMYPKNPPEADKIIKNYAVIHGSKLYCPDLKRLTPETMGVGGSRFLYKGREYRTAMAGVHQIYNAVTAIEALNVLKKEYLRLTGRKIRKGIATAKMPSRCQIVRDRSPMVIIDGAHNPYGMRALSEFIKTLPHYPKIMICGMSADKDWQTALSYIAPLIDKAYCIDGFCPRTVFAPRLAEMFSDAECLPLSDVYRRAFAVAGDRGLLLIGGSLYLPSALNKFSG